ncbi:hypothetical protein ACFPTZ_27560 [Rubritalea tangerina]
MRLSELAAVAFIEDEDNLLVVDRELFSASHEVVELLDGGNDDFIVFFIEVTFQPAVLSDPLTLSGEKRWYSFIVW